MVLGIDFDGTLSFGKWPKCGPANVGLFDFLKKRKAEKGFPLKSNTPRANDAHPLEEGRKYIEILK